MNNIFLIAVLICSQISCTPNNTIDTSNNIDIANKQMMIAKDFPYSNTFAIFETLINHHTFFRLLIYNVKLRIILYKKSIGNLITQFFGEGEWMPKPDSWDKTLTKLMCKPK